MKEMRYLLGWMMLVGMGAVAGDARLDPTRVEQEVGKYPLKVCVVSGEKLGNHGKPVVLRHDGREVQLCCQGCIKDFQKEPRKYLAPLDAAVEAQQRTSYPLKECPVSLERLGGHAEPVGVVVGNNTLVRLCCQACRKEAYREAVRIEKLIRGARPQS